MMPEICHFLRPFFTECLTKLEKDFWSPGCCDPMRKPSVLARWPIYMGQPCSLQAIRTLVKYTDRLRTQYSGPMPPHLGLSLHTEPESPQPAHT